MGILSNRTERKALYEIAKTLRYFENVDDLKVTKDDAFDIRTAERLLRGVIENNGYKAEYSKYVRTKITRTNSNK